MAVLVVRRLRVYQRGPVPKVVAPPPARRYSLAEGRDEYSELYSPQLKECNGITRGASSMSRLRVKVMGRLSFSDIRQPSWCPTNAALCCIHHTIPPAVIGRLLYIVVVPEHAVNDKGTTGLTFSLFFFSLFPAVRCRRLRAAASAASLGSKRKVPRPVKEARTP